MKNLTSWNWQAMLTEFRRLGGIAENIEQRRGLFGNGIFPTDPEKPIAIYVPEALLVDADDYVIRDGDLVIKSEFNAPDDVHLFLNSYQKHFSWGADGKTGAEKFELSLRSLPETVLLKLKQLHLLDLDKRHQATWEEVVRQRFLQSRRINYHSRKVSMPIIELINHGARSHGYTISKGIGYKGRFDGEVMVNYSPNSDAMLRFLTYGFANYEPRAYSFPTRIKATNGRVLVVAHDFGKVDRHKGVLVPQVEEKGNVIRISHVLIASENTPRMPRTIFREALKELPIDIIDELFDRIRAENQLALCDILELAEEDDTEVAKTLSRAVRCQLRALGHCFGARVLQ